MNKLKTLKLFGDYLNNYDINFLENNNLEHFIFSSYIINPELPINKKYIYSEPSLSKTFLYNNNIIDISIVYNYLKDRSNNENYNGIDLLSDIEREKAYKLLLFNFPKKLSIISFKNFVDKNFLKFYLIPLLNMNKKRLSQIKTINLNNCFLDINQFNEFISILPLMEKLRVLSINNIPFFEKFKMNHLIESNQNILKNASNLLELDLSNNKYNKKIFIDNIMNLIGKIPKNLLILRFGNTNRYF